MGTLMLTGLVQQQHRALRQLFSQHQRAVLEASFDNAIILLDRYSLYHQAHTKLEERYLFPEFAQLERDSQWGVDLYKKEHEKMHYLLDKLVQQLCWINKQQCSDIKREDHIISLLDQEKTVKGLTEHHEQREEKGMLIELDAQLDPKRKKTIISDFKSAWIETTALIYATSIKKCGGPDSALR